MALVQIYICIERCALGGCLKRVSRGAAARLVGTETSLSREIARAVILHIACPMTPVLSASKATPSQ